MSNWRQRAAYLNVEPLVRSWRKDLQTSETVMEERLEVSVSASFLSEHNKVAYERPEIRMRSQEQFLL